MFGGKLKTVLFAFQREQGRAQQGWYQTQPAGQIKITDKEVNTETLKITRELV